MLLTVSNTGVAVAGATGAYSIPWYVVFWFHAFCKMFDCGLFISCSEIQPSIASSLGGSVLSVRGVFAAGVSLHYCRFDFSGGVVTVAAVYINSSSLTCLTPAVAAGTPPTVVSISADGGVTFHPASPLLSFTGAFYVHCSNLSILFCLSASLYVSDLRCVLHRSWRDWSVVWPATWRWVHYYIGTQPDRVSNVSCLFENVAVAAASVDVSDGVVICPVASQTEGTVNVTLLHDGVPFVWSFVYYGTILLQLCSFLSHCFVLRRYSCSEWYRCNSYLGGRASIYQPLS